MLAERTSDHETLFKENEEAVFFSSPEEVVEKALRLVSDAALRQSIAEAGWRRVYADGHSVDDRMKQFLDVINSLW